MTGSNDLTKEEDILKLLEITGGKKLALQAFKYSISIFKETVPEIVEMFEKEISVEALVEELFIHVYNKYFTEAEIEEMIEFYESAIGQKMVKQAPKIYQEVTALAQQRIQKILEKFEDKKEEVSTFRYFS